MGELAQSAFTGVRMPLLMEQEHDPRDFTSLHFDAGIRVTSLEFVQGFIKHVQTCSNRFMLLKETSEIIKIQGCRILHGYKLIC